MENIEDQLKKLESLHKRHQAKMEWQEHHKYSRRERHRNGWHRIKPTAQVLP